MAAKITGRALHYVFKIGDRGKNSYFFRDILGMKVLRHEEFKEGCDAQCNGPYDNRWSKTMVGYGPEASHFVIELTYNYGIKNYELGNDFGGITIHSKEIIERAREKKYPICPDSDDCDSYVLISPDGYKFFVVNKEQPTDSDPLKAVTLNVTNLEGSKQYWHKLLHMNVVAEEEKLLSLSYGENQTVLQLQEVSEELNRAKAYGRIAFAVPKNQQEVIDVAVKEYKGTILTPLITLETPGKATVRVIILADPDGHEICFVDEEGFGELSQVEDDGATRLDRFIKKDPFQDK